MEFLRELAETFIREEGDSLKEICFVFPNRRSSLFFQKYLSEASDRTMFAPTLLTISTLFFNLSGLRSTDKIGLLTQLYTVYRQYSVSPDETFDDFIYWGDMILNDFDDIDKYRVDAEKLFVNIQDLKALDTDYSFLSERQRNAVREFWSDFNLHSGSAKEQTFLSLWTVLYDIYVRFKERLEKRGEGYEGMIYRKVAETLMASQTLPDFFAPYRKVVFVGLNALNECEKVLLDTLKDSGKGDFYWDYYGRVITDTYNKSSLFMKDNVLRYPSAHPLKAQEYHEEDIDIEVIGVPSRVGQAKYVYDLLEELVPEEKAADLMKTAIVLPEEDLLMPLLNSIPERIDKINVTMGYSLNNTNISSFMNLVAQLHKKARVYHEQICFYYQTVLNLLEHPYIKKQDRMLSKILKDGIVAENLIFIPYERLKGSPLIEAVFRPVTLLESRPERMIAALADYQQALLQLLQDQVGDLDKEFLFAYHKSINRLKDIEIPIQADTYFNLLQQLVAKISIPFTGEPLSGLQIMGPLETRALDFENMIILSLNDGVFPSSSVSTSLIPYNLRKGWGLPNYEFQDSIAAYHFYRSIYRLKRLYLLYDTRVEGLNSGEVSRFIKQMKYHHGLSMKESVAAYRIAETENAPTVVAKDGRILRLLTRKKYSASSINTYLSCPLKFYYQYVEDLKIEDEVVLEMEASTFGTLFHQVMSDVYGRHKGKTVDSGFIDSLLGDAAVIRGFIRSAFDQCLHIGDIYGQNRIVEALLERYVRRTLEYDRGLAPFHFLSSEERIQSGLKVGDRKISLIGFIDRLDRLDGQYRIIDYKTGSISIDFKTVDDLFKVDQNRPYTALQLFIYLYMLRQNGIADADSSMLVIYSLKDIFRGVTPQFAVTGQQLEDFEERLTRLFAEILDPDIPFKACSDEEVCANCDFKLLCRR